MVKPKLENYGMSGKKRCTRCGAIGVRHGHKCKEQQYDSPKLVDGLWRM